MHKVLGAQQVIAAARHVMRAEPAAGRGAYPTPSHLTLEVGDGGHLAERRVLRQPARLILQVNLQLTHVAAAVGGRRAAVELGRHLLLRAQEQSRAPLRSLRGGRGCTARTTRRLPPAPPRCAASACSPPCAPAPARGAARRGSPSWTAPEGSSPPQRSGPLLLVSGLGSRWTRPRGARAATAMLRGRCGEHDGLLRVGCRERTPASPREIYGSPERAAGR